MNNQPHFYLLPSPLAELDFNRINIALLVATVEGFELDVINSAIGLEEINQLLS